MIFQSWCRHHLGGPYATIVATAMLNLLVIIILGEVRDTFYVTTRTAFVVSGYQLYFCYYFL
jgi:hypothetical protein